MALLETDAEPGAPPDAVYVRARMTRGRARCLSGGGPDAIRQAEADLEEAARLAAALRAVELTLDVARHLGTCAMLRADYAEAERHFRDALAMGREAREPLLEAKAAMNLGLLRIWRSRYDEAVDWLGKALDLATGLDASLLVVKTLTNLGWCYYELGDYERALVLHSRAESLAAAEGAGYEGERQIALQNIGNVHYRSRDFARAADYYRRSLAIARELGDEWRIAELLNNLGVVALEQGGYDEAESSIREAVRISTELGDVAGLQYSRLAEGLVWAGRGNATRAEGRYREVLASPDADPALSWVTGVALAGLYGRMGRPVAADAEFRKAFSVMERSYSELREAEHRISFFSSLDEFHDDYVDFLVEGGMGAAALEVADASRARLLREMLGKGGTFAKVAAPRFQDAARALDAVILFYWLAPSRSYLWSVTPRRVRRHELPGEGEIRKHVESHQSLVLRSRDPLAEAAPEGEWLYRTLVGPVEASIPPGSRVVFVPDGPLHQVNPETLLVSSPEPHYWIEDVTLLAAPSISVLAADEARPVTRRRVGKSILMIGDPVPAGEEFPRLAHASGELSRISEQFAPSERVVYSGARAQPSAYRESEPERFSFIHFAAHAQGNREVPLDSAVILSAGNESSKLYAREIADVPVRAELVTLSACRTAGSRTFAGEGLVGLTWAFLSSGAGNVIAGLWNVEDASTSEVMGDLYHGLRQGQRPEEALREAKLRMLRSETAYRKPFYWAPFMVYTSRLDPAPRAAGPS